ncbi:MAG: PD-(D/E)XK nuclease family protein [Planctomycetota bacterium]|jgi:hypothetical protein
MRRIWMGTEAPALARAAEWLLRNGAAGSTDAARPTVDLQETVCIAPGRRAGRTLLAELVRRAADEGTVLVPPRIVTPGTIGEALLAGGPARATPEERLQAWVAALRAAAPDALARLLPEPPDREDHLAWRALARLLDAVHEQLAGERMDFAEALRRAGPGEVARWRVLIELHDGYDRALDGAGLADPAAAGERALAGGRLRGDARPVLVGVPDLNGRQRGVVEAYGDRATALVFADAADEERFDEMGCVRPDAWATVPIAVPEERIVVADRPADQARVVLQRLAALDGRRAASSISIGLGDESLAAPLTRAGRWAGVAFHHASGRPLHRSAPYRLLESAAAWARHRTARHLAELIRHPDLERWLTGEHPDGGDGPITALDRYHADHLPATMDRGGADAPAAVADLCRRVADLLEPLTGPPQPLASWVEPIFAVLRAVHAAGASGATARPALAEACAALRDAAMTLRRAPGSLQPVVDGPTALETLLEACAAATVPEEPRPEQVEMLGWLEVALDPAPVLIVVGVNDGAVPGAVTADPLLPEALRRSLGARLERRRYARDAYWLDLLMRSGRDVTLVAGRRGAEGDPLPPSRLLLAGDPDRLVPRVRRFCRPDPQGIAAPPHGLAAGASSRFLVPALPPDLGPPTAMRVTDFKLYLQCPYRYALRRLLRVERIDDDAEEMTPLQFGSLAHEVLEAFARTDAVRDEDDALLIEAFLHDELHRRATRRFGPSPLPAAAVQLARLCRRLSAFARCQAELRRDGWAIRHWELPFRGEPALPVADQAPMPLRGTIDRIDQHEPTGRWRVIDYKTGEAGEDPLVAHHGSGRGSRSDPGEPPCRWADLQLPLYRHLVTAGDLALDGPIELGYFLLPRQVESTGFRPAAWSEAQLADAMDRAAAIVRDIRARRLDLNRDFASTFDEYARLCQTSALGVAEKDDAA